MNYDQFFSADTGSMMRSPVRDLLSRYDRSRLISFAGGYPDPAVFPAAELAAISADILRENAAEALQYGASEGYLPLRELIAERYLREGVDVTAGEINITTSSQQAIDICTRILTDPGDVILCTIPTYLGALQSFRSFRADVVGVESVETCERTIFRAKEEGKRIKFFYVIPDFQNPSGITMTYDERVHLLEMAVKYDFLILEDTPYREIRYEGEQMPLIKALEQRFYGEKIAKGEAASRVVELGSFSKTFAPGFRLGWTLSPPEIAAKLTLAKQSADLCTPVFNQMVLERYIRSGSYDDNILKVTRYYKEKRDLILGLFEKFMPSGVSWTRPEGGLFLFLTLPEGSDTGELFRLALESYVAFVEGGVFHCNGTGKNTMRINYSFMPREKIEKGVEILAGVIADYLKIR